MKSQFSHNTRSAKIIQKEINIVGIIKKKEEIRKVIEPKTETVNYVCHATLHDDFGSIPITLWKYDVLRVSNFDEITITNGYSYVFQGEIRISAGYEGTLTTKKTWGKNHYQSNERTQKPQSYYQNQPQESKENRSNVTYDGELRLLNFRKRPDYTPETKFSKKRFRLTDASLDNLCHEFAMNRTPEQSNKEFFGFMSILNGFFVSEFADRKKDDENEQ